MATPFLDSLSSEEKVYVAEYSKRENRPSYFDASVAQAAEATGDEETTGFFQISQDLEAVLILTPTQTKVDIRLFLEDALRIASNNSEDDYSLMAEIVSLRKHSYRQVSLDSGGKVKSYDLARQKLLEGIERRARANAPEGTPIGESVSIVIPDLSAMFSAVSKAYDDIMRPDELMVHDRISDAGILYALQNDATNRAKELSSWIDVFTVYITMT